MCEYKENPRTPMKDVVHVVLVQWQKIQAFGWTKNSFKNEEKPPVLYLASPQGPTGPNLVVFSQLSISQGPSLQTAIILYFHQQSASLSLMAFCLHKNPGICLNIFNWI